MNIIILIKQVKQLKLISDVHIGKFVQELISNGVYNADIAVNRYRNAIN